MSVNPQSPVLGRPLSFPNDHHPATFTETHRASIPDVPYDTTSSSDTFTPHQQPSQRFSNVPLRDREESEGVLNGRETDDGHSLANTFGTMDMRHGEQGERSSAVEKSSTARNTPASAELVGAPTANDNHQNSTSGPDQLEPKMDQLKNSILAPRPDPKPTNIVVNRDSSSETMREAPSSSSSRPEHLPELKDPSDHQLLKAGMVAGSAAGAGAAAREILVSRGHGVSHEGGGREPRGYMNVEVPDKWGITSSRIKEARWKATKKALILFGFITLWLWICLSIFWGSTYRLTNFLPSLTVHVIPFDTPSGTSYLNGPMIKEANYVASLPSSVVHLGYEVKDPANYPNGLDDVRRSVIAQDCWAAIVVNANASTAWTNALTSGDASYDPTGAIGIYYAGARFYQVVLLYFNAIISETLTNPLSTARSNALEAFMASASTNPTLLTNAARVPQAIGVGFGYTIFDVRPIQNYAWAGAAPMEASLIYFIIFAFYLALFGGMARMKSGLQQRIKFTSMLRLRMGWPLLAYFFISLWQTLVVRAWQVPLTDHLGRAGFVTLWALNYVTIIAAGFAMETVLAVVGISWLPFFLILWIILNITSSFYPIEMMPNFYRFLRWMPFVHNVEVGVLQSQHIAQSHVDPPTSLELTKFMFTVVLSVPHRQLQQAYKIIAFGTDLQHRLGLHFGIIFAVIGVELIFLPLALFFERWSSDRSARKQQEQKAAEEKEKKQNDGGQGEEA
ncbi:hypothetical protein I316_02530 [Kwoniella heveanensis BCC8398]|uniref:DUF3533 domain-containing protein n=1 Tax=Kwoniella heveanensis BCC8398 TaxID=1296120 RepID=A0A1B9GYB5_9TREE|nr:hypothetical protein I316_02530 [Kwoniella heveanensis BCC8398]